MLESTQTSIISQGQVFNPINRIGGIMRAGGKLMLWLVSPEDTSENLGGRKHHASPSCGITLGTAFKLVFWMAAAVTLSILMGQLC